MKLHRDTNDSLIQVLMTHKLLLKLYEFYRLTLYFVTLINPPFSEWKSVWLELAIPMMYHTGV